MHPASEMSECGPVTKMRILNRRVWSRELARFINKNLSTANITTCRRIHGRATFRIMPDEPQSALCTLLSVDASTF
jgi:hypothetical protein